MTPCIYTHQFAADNVMSNTTMKLHTCSSDNKCEKLWIVVYNQSATNMYITVHHYKTPRRAKLYKSFQKTNYRTLSYMVVASNSGLLYRVCHSLSCSQKSSAHIYNVETQTAINYKWLLTNARPVVGTTVEFVWVSVSSKHGESWKTSCMHCVTDAVTSGQQRVQGCVTNAVTLVL